MQTVLTIQCQCNPLSISEFYFFDIVIYFWRGNFVMVCICMCVQFPMSTLRPSMQQKPKYVLHRLMKYYNVENFESKFHLISLNFGARQISI